MNQKLFRKEVVENKENKLSGEIILNQPVSFYLITAFLTTFTVVGISLLLAGDYSRKQTVIGFLVPDKGVVAAYPPQVGTLDGLFVSEGDEVKLGDDLFQVRPEQRINVGSNISQQILDILRYQETAFKNKVDLEKELLESTLEGYEQSRIQYQDEISQLESLMESQQEIVSLELAALERSRVVFSIGGLPQDEMDYEEERYLEKLQLLQTINFSLNQTNYSLQQVKFEQDATIINSSRAILDIENNLFEISKQQYVTQGDLNNLIQSPVNGRVASVMSTIGQRVDVNSAVLLIIPKDSILEANLYIPSQAIGFIKLDQEVNIKFDAFPYQKFGFFSGTIKEISEAVISQRDIPVSFQTQESVYKVTVSLDQQSASAYGEEFQFKSGMLLNADVILDRRSLFEWLFEPLYSMQRSN